MQDVTAPEDIKITTEYFVIGPVCGGKERGGGRRKRQQRMGGSSFTCNFKEKKGRRPSRWQRRKRWRSPSSPQIHQKYIYTWNCSYRTPTELWQKMSDLPKGKKLPTYLGRSKEKKKKQRQRLGKGPAPVGGSREGGKVSTH